MRWLELKLPPVLLVALCMLVMAAVKAYINFDLVFDSEQEIGGIFAALGLLVIVAGVVQFKIAKTTVNPTRPHETVTVVATGIFNRTRNPMYLGMLLVLIGWFVYLGAGLNALVLVVFVLYMNRFQIHPEETMLKKRFGDEYEQYLTRVRRWI